jgi:Dolichyl-phosphate-mannose-protein mannosyltransferase
MGETAIVRPAMTQQAQNRQTFWGQLTEPRHVVSMLLLYCLFNFVLRLALSPDLSPGDAGQVLFGQSFRWGYQALQPPLMTWLSWGVLAASQQSHAAFFFLRYMLMAFALAAYFAAARTVIGDVRVAAFAAFALTATFAFGWLAHLGAPQNVLLALMLALYLWADAAVIARGALRDYVALGAIAGLGVLSSYVFLVLPAALALALIAVPRFLARLKPLRLLLALAIALAIVAPYVLLGQVHGADATGQDIAKSAGILGVHLIGLILPYALIFPFLFGAACKPLGDAKDGDARDWLRLYDIAMIAAVAIVLALLFMLDEKTLKGPWFYPAAMLLPIYLFLRARLSGWTERNGKIFALAVLAIALVSAGARVAVYEMQGEHCRECSAWWPMRTYEDAFQRSGFLQGTIVGSSVTLAGNLRGVFADARVLTPGYAPDTFGPPRGGACLVVWEGDGAAPKAMRDYLSAALHVRPDAETVRGDVQAKLLKTRRHLEPMSFMLFPPGICR